MGSSAEQCQKPYSSQWPAKPTQCNYQGNYYCGVCFEDLGPRDGAKGRWQKYGDWREQEKKWVYMCPSCSKYLWRLYSKGEYDLQNLNNEVFFKDFLLFLKYELKKTSESSS